MKQQLFLDQRYGYNLPDKSVLFWLQDPIILPSNEYEFAISIPHATIPLTHWVVTQENNTLVIARDSYAVTVQLPQGNYSVDELVDHVNAAQAVVVMSYSDNRNTVSFQSVASEAEIVIAPGTSCQKLFGFRVGDTSVSGVLECALGVNLQGTQSFFIRSNMRTRNRDPVLRGFGNLLASVPITRAHNGIEVYTNRGLTVSVTDRSIHYIILQILDDDQNPVTFHGGQWSVTLEFDVVDHKVFRDREDFRSIINNGQVTVSENPAPGERSNTGNGQSQRG